MYEALSLFKHHKKWERWRKQHSCDWNVRKKSPCYTEYECKEPGVLVHGFNSCTPKVEAGKLSLQPGMAKMVKANWC